MEAVYIQLRDNNHKREVLPFLLSLGYTIFYSKMRTVEEYFQKAGCPRSCVLVVYNYGILDFRMDQAEYDYIPPEVITWANKEQYSWPPTSGLTLQNTG